MNWWEADPVADSPPMQMAAKSTASWWQNDPVAEQKQEGWGDWLKNSIQGRQDPAFADAAQNPPLHRYYNDLGQSFGLAGLGGASDTQMADILESKLGDRLVKREKDKNGYDVFTTKGENGKNYRFYVNKPGLDTYDVARGVEGYLPYMIPAEGAILAGAGRGLATRAALGGVAGWTGSAAGDVALEKMGSKQGIEGDKGLVSAAAGMLGPVASSIGGALWRRFVLEPKFFDRATGTLTQEGMQQAEKLGIDPKTLTADAVKSFAKTLAASPDEAAKLVGSGNLEFNIPQTLGQRTKDPEQLLLEKSMRTGNYGQAAKEMINGLYDEQTRSVENAVRSTLPKQFMSSAGHRPLPENVASHLKDASVTLQKDDAGSYLQSALKNAQTAARQQEDSAWKETAPLDLVRKTTTAPDIMAPMTGVQKTVTASEGAKPLLADSIRENLGDLANVWDPEKTPVAYRMGTFLDDFVNGKAPSTKLHSAFGIDRQNGVDSVRKSIGLMMKDAATPTDRAASGAIYKAYGDWMRKAADHGLLTGNLDDVAKFSRAVDVSREMNNMFRPLIRGKPTPGSKIIEKVLNLDTPEQVVDAIFGSPKAGIKAGSIEAIRRMRQAAGTYGDRNSAIDMWSGLKVSHWSTLVQDKQGQLFSPQVMLNNIRSSLQSQRTLVNELYSPTDRASISRFVRQLEGIVWKDPNPSGTATALVSLLKGVFGRLMARLPEAAQAAVEFSGVPRAYGTALARRAVSQLPHQGVATRVSPAAVPAFSALGGQYARSRDE